MPSAKPAPAATKRLPKRTPEADADTAPSALIDARIRDLGDWRGEMLARLRAVIVGADPRVIEAWKWNGPVWTADGHILCTGEAYQRAVKLTFAHGASLPDPAGLFNASLDGRVRRAIDFPQGAPVDATALAALIRAAVDAAGNGAHGPGAVGTRRRPQRTPRPDRTDPSSP